MHRRACAASTGGNADSIWTVPPGWQSVPPSQFLLAEFSIPGADGAKAEVNVAEMGGEGGGLLANVNRWRGQLGLGAISDSDLSQHAQSLDVPGGKATLVDFTRRRRQDRRAHAARRRDRAAKRPDLVLQIDGRQARSSRSRRTPSRNSSSRQTMRTLVDRVIRFFTSLRLTVVLLAFAIVLVFIGTLAQVDEGLYNAQARYFRQWLIFGLDVFGHRIPLLLPGGYLIGTMLLLNLVAAHIYRFQLSVKKIGIQIVHSGVILLLVGQLATDMLAHESQMHFVEGETKSYAESSRNNELAFTTDAGAGGERGHRHPRPAPGQRRRDPGRQSALHDPRQKLLGKFRADVPRADDEKRAAADDQRRGATASIFSPPRKRRDMDEKNVPTALIEIIGANGSLGDWVVSDWTSRRRDGARACRTRLRRSSWARRWRKRSPTS